MQLSKKKKAAQESSQTANTNFRFDLAFSDKSVYNRGNDRAGEQRYVSLHNAAPAVSHLQQKGLSPKRISRHAACPAQCADFDVGRRSALQRGRQRPGTVLRRILHPTRGAAPARQMEPRCDSPAGRTMRGGAFLGAGTPLYAGGYQLRILAAL